MRKDGSLSDKHQDIVRLYCIGSTFNEIAREVDLSTDTVKVIIRDIKAQWTGGGMSRSDFFIRAQIGGIVPKFVSPTGVTFTGAEFRSAEFRSVEFTS
jgi:Bacterial regulatory proteins, luxR family